MVPSVLAFTFLAPVRAFVAPQTLPAVFPRSSGYTSAPHQKRHHHHRHYQLHLEGRLRSRSSGSSITSAEKDRGTFSGLRRTAPSLACGAHRSSITSSSDSGRTPLTRRYASGYGYSSSSSSRDGRGFAGGGGGNGGEEQQEEGPASLTLTQLLVVANVMGYAAQLVSAYSAHGRISDLFRAAGQRPPTAQERGLPFSLPQYSVGLGAGRSISGQGHFTRDFIMDPRYVRSRRVGMQTYRCLSSAFLHGSVLHLGMNMWNLNRVGHMLESLNPSNVALAKRRKKSPPSARGSSSLQHRILLAGTYVLSALTGSYAHLTYSRNPALGASGAIMGLYGFTFAFFKRAGNEYQAQSVLRYMITLLLFGMWAPNVANAAHVGGFLGGAAACVVCGPRVVERNTSNRVSLDLYAETTTRRVMDFNGAFVPVWAVLLFGAVLLPAGRRMTWQLPAAVQLHALRPGALASGASPLSAVPVGARKYIRLLRAA